jgi:uncharacterized membrane protein (UPF0127 family)
MLQAHVLFHNDVEGAPSGTLLVDVPDSMHEMRQGLAGRPAIAEGSGMLFDMGVEAHHRFHMIGVAFPLDFIFVTSNRRVVAVLPSQPPGLPEVGGISRWVIEAPAGWAAQHGVRAGTIVSFV